MKWWSIPALVLAIAGSVGFAIAQSATEHSIESRSIESNGEKLTFSVRAFAPDANMIDPAAALEPVSALQTAKLLNRYLTDGKIEEAALLSNAPRRRFEVLTDYKESVGEEGFKGVFAEYFKPANRVLAEVTMGGHSLLVWYLADRTQYAGQYYVTVEGKVLLDDVPNETRAKLRQVMEAIRAGRLSLPAK